MPPEPIKQPDIPDRSGSSQGWPVRRPPLYDYAWKIGGRWKPYLAWRLRRGTLHAHGICRALGLNGDNREVVRSGTFEQLEAELMSGEKLLVISWNVFVIAENGVDWKDFLRSSDDMLWTTARWPQ